MNSFGKALIFILFYFLSIFVFAQEKILTDVLGRQVKVDVPAKRIALGFYYTDFLAVGGANAFDNVVGFSKEVWTDWTPSSWEVYSKSIPKLNQIEDIGEVEVGTFSVEKVLSLKPDLLVLSDWQYQVLELELENIEKAGIPIIVLDYNREKVDLHVKSTKLLGEITGQVQRANSLVEFYENTVKLVQERVKNSNLPKPKIYIEFGNKGPKESGFTYGKDMWGALIDLAGGENIAAPFVEKWSPINPEKVIASKPDVIMIAGRETEYKKNEEAMVMGFSIPKQEALRRLKGYVQRSGWKNLPAIKNNRLYGIYMGASRTLADASMVEYIAKALYPDLFKDIDPIKTYLDYHKKYLPIVPEGTFGIAIND